MEEKLRRMEGKMSVDESRKHEKQKAEKQLLGLFLRSHFCAPNIQIAIGRACTACDNQINTVSPRPNSPHDSKSELEGISAIFPYLYLLNYKLTLSNAGFIVGNIVEVQSGI